MVIEPRTAVLLCTLVALTGAAVGAAAGLGYRVDHGGGQAVATGPGHAVRPARIPDPQRGDDAFIGVVIPASSVKLTAREASEVADIRASVGTAVGEGDVVVVLRSRSVDDDLKVGQASIDKVSAEQQQLERELQQASERLNRTVALGEYAPREVLDESRASVEIVQAKLSRARAALREQRSALQKRQNDRRELLLRAPFAGTVGSRFVDKGAVVEPMQAIIELVSAGPHLVRFAVPAERRLETGPGSAVWVSAAGERAAAVVNALHPSIDPVSGLFYAELTLTAAASARFSPGMAVRVQGRRPEDVPPQARAQGLPGGR